MVADAIINIVKVSISSDEVVDKSVQDSVYAYATDYLTMALLCHGFHDAIKMGDGNRIMLLEVFNRKLDIVIMPKKIS